VLVFLSFRVTLRVLLPDLAKSQDGVRVVSSVVSSLSKFPFPPLHPARPLEFSGSLSLSSQGVNSQVALVFFLSSTLGPDLWFVSPSPSDST